MLPILRLHTHNSQDDLQGFEKDENLLMRKRNVFAFKALQTFTLDWLALRLQPLMANSLPALILFIYSNPSIQETA